VSNPVLAGSVGFTGVLDELNFYPRALSATDVTTQYQSYPKLPPNQPLTPTPT